MTNPKLKPGPADSPGTVAAIYADSSIAASYLQKRMKFSWQRLLHRRQVAVLNEVIARYRPRSVLEVAPGPARLAVELRGIERGVMVENSLEMIAISHKRLAEADLAGIWTVQQGDAFHLAAALPEIGFDLAYTFRFLRHFKEPERAQLYAQIARQLAPGGKLVFDVVNARIREPIERKQQARADGEISIYDVWYTREAFTDEMRSHGFETLQMIPVIRHFAMQAWLSHKGEDIAPGAISGVVNLLESLPSREPLEWIAICKKI
jgi:ubiquinone/menaquinone biosynthesis C-methylase UbiE